MNNKQLLIGGIVFLFALNLFTIGFMLWDKKHDRGNQHCGPKFGHHMEGYKGGPHHCSPEGANGKCASFHGKQEHPGERMARILNLSEEQKTLMKAEREAHFAKMKDLKKEKGEIKKALFGLLKEDEVDSTKMNALLDNVAVNERSEKEELIHHFMTIRDNLTEDQLTKFEEMIEKMNRHFHKRDSLKKM